MTVAVLHTPRMMQNVKWFSRTPSLALHRAGKRLSKVRLYDVEDMQETH